MSSECGCGLVGCVQSNSVHMKEPAIILLLRGRDVCEAMHFELTEDQSVMYLPADGSVALE